MDDQIESTDNPTFLYKYRGVRSEEALERLRVILVQHQLWFSRPIDFNDPFDCAPAVNTTLTDEGLIATAISVADRRTRDQPGHVRAAMRAELIKNALEAPKDLMAIQAAAKKLMADIRGEIGVFSLSAKPDDVLMWSHYGESHTGICLRFRVSESKLIQEAQPVRYQQERPVIDLIGDRENTMEKALLHKASYWDYEEEWRVIRVKSPGLHEFEPAALDAIIFGAKIDPDNERVVRAAVVEGGAGQEFFRAQFDEELFKLNIVPC